MGVRGLTSHMKQSRAGHSTEFRPVYRGGNSKVVIFDALSVLRYFMQPEVAIFCDFQKLFEKVRRYVDSFRRCGFELVAVLDGSVDEDKLPEWIQRRKTSYKGVLALNELFGSGDRPARYNQNHARKKLTMTTSSGFYLGQALKASGCEVIWSTAEADKEIAYLCNQRSAYAVISCDSDFFIFDIPRLIDSQSIRFERGGSIRCTMYERENILRAIGLPQKYLYKLAALMGCDVTKRSRSLENIPVTKRAPTAVRNIMQCSQSNQENSEKFEKTRKFYTPCAPRTERTTDPSLISLRLGVYQRGVAVEDLMRTPGHVLLAPLRLQVYAKLGLTVVREYLCCSITNDDGSSTWSYQREARVDPSRDSHPDVPASVPRDKGELVRLLVRLVCKFGGEIVTAAQKNALLGQYFKRNTFYNRRVLTRYFPRTQDLHARNLFLQIWGLVG
eukprot:192766_1